ncbi:MAG: ornithine cyclodeaminase family protein [Halobacteriales archaeon]|nr:ornithine cyclodeaminase family protein [Halobacteriales archaeon]
METLLLDADTVEVTTPMDALVPSVEAAFAADARGETQMPAKSYIDLPQYNGDFRSMPAYLDVGEWDASGVKWVNVHPDNRRDHDLPTVMGTYVYADPETGFPLSIMDGTVLTKQRTGAAAAVATDYLARPDASRLGIVGAGVQSYTQLTAIATVRDIETVVIADRNPEAIAAFIETWGDSFDVREGTIAEAGHCDILSTVTPVREPLVGPADIGDGTHINAMGADAVGKHELTDDLLTAATIVIDDYEQCTHSGEINVPWSTGVLSDADLYGELGEIVLGEIPGRTADDEVTVFDSTGLAIQDVAAAHIAYERAMDQGLGTPFDLLGLT